MLPVREPTGTCVPGRGGWIWSHEPFGRTADVVIPDFCPSSSGSLAALFQVVHSFRYLRGAVQRGGGYVCIYGFDTGPDTSHELGHSSQYLLLCKLLTSVRHVLCHLLNQEKSLGNGEEVPSNF